MGSAENAWSNFQPTHMARIVPTILLHFLHPWRSDVGSAENAWSNFQPTHMARIVPTILLHFLHPWRSDVGSAENAYVHGWTVVGQCICPWMDGSRTTQEQLSRSNFQPLHPWRFTGIVPDNSQHTTHMARIVPTILLHFLHPWRSDVGSAENAYVHGWTVVGQRRSSCRGAIFSHSIHGDKK